MLSERLNSLEIDVIDMLNNTAPGAAEAFLSSPDTIKPPNKYDKLDIDRVRKNLAELDEIRDSAEYQGLSSYNRLYADMIVDYYHRQNTFVAACYDHLHCETTKKRSPPRDSVRRTSDFSASRTGISCLVSLVKNLMIYAHGSCLPRIGTNSAFRS